jgi:hypothetical protein
MRTLEQIQAQQAADRAELMAAQRHAELQGAQSRLRTEIGRLQEATVDLTPLRDMHARAADVSPVLLTRSVKGLAFSVPGGMRARDLLITVIGAALSQAEQKEAERVADLAKLRGELDAVERELAAMEAA